jgi:hypothetical protein
MSFINMMADDVWSEQDITSRTEAMVRSVMPLQDELVLNRKVQGAALGEYTLTAEDQADMAILAQAGFSAQQEGIAARADMALLLEVFAVEVAEKRLAEPVVEPILDEEGEVTNQDEIDTDEAERAEAQAVVDAAPAEVMEWVEQRRPTPPPEEEVVPEEILDQEPVVD